jgi:hypothetical protein
MLRKEERETHDAWGEDVQMVLKYSDILVLGTAGARGVVANRSVAVIGAASHVFVYIHT